VRILGKLENIRVVQLCLFQGIAKVSNVAPTVEMTASDNPALQNQKPDPTIFCTAFKKNRFYMVSGLRRPMCWQVTGKVSELTSSCSCPF